MSYGRLTRSEVSGYFSLQYGWWSWCEGHYSGWSFASPGPGIIACVPNLNQWWYGWQQNLFQVITLFIHLDPFSNYTSSGFVLAPGGGWSPIGRDLIAYIYIRDPMGW